MRTPRCSAPNRRTRETPVTLRAQRGFSLTEAMIASLITLIAVGALYSGLAQTQVFWENYSGSVDMRQNSRVAIGQITTELRMLGYDVGSVADVLTRADNFDLQFVANVDQGDERGPCDAQMEANPDGGAERITYSVDSGTRSLLRAVDCWDGAAWIPMIDAAAVLTDLDLDIAIFRFMDRTGTQIPLGGGPLDADARADVGSVVVVFDLVDIDNTRFAGDEHTNLRIETQIHLHNRQPTDDDSSP